MKHNREWYIPKGSQKVEHKTTGAVVYFKPCTGRSGATFQAVAFHGKAQKPDWNFLFKTREQMERRIRYFFDCIQAHADQAAKRRAERQAVKNKLQVGHILKASWGYDQTNVDWYEVTRIVGAQTVEVRKVAGFSMNGEGSRVVPQTGQYISEPMTKRVKYDGATVRIDSVRTAYLWSGKPAYETPFGCGH